MDTLPKNLTDAQKCNRMLEALKLLSHRELQMMVMVMAFRGGALPKSSGMSFALMYPDVSKEMDEASGKLIDFLKR